MRTLSKYTSLSIIAVAVSMAILGIFGFPWWSIFGLPVWLLVTWLVYYSYIQYEVRSRGTKKPGVTTTVLTPVLVWGATIGCSIFLIGHSYLFEEIYLNLAKPFGYSPTTSTELVNSQLGEKRLVMPKNYAWHTDSQKSGPKDMLMLDVLYPDMEPYTAANRGKFLNVGLKRSIKITIYETATDMFQSYFSIQYQERASGTFGDLNIYSRVKEEADSGFGAGLYLLGPRHAPVYYLICDKSEGYSYPPNPGCEARVTVDGMGVEYMYSRALLNDWQRIDKGVKQLVRSFIQTN